MFYRDNFGELRRLCDCEEQCKKPFYSDFVLRSIIKMFGPFGAWQGGGVAYQKVGYKTPFLYVR